MFYCRCGNKIILCLFYNINPYQMTLKYLSRMFNVWKSVLPLKGNILYFSPKFLFKKILGAHFTPPLQSLWRLGDVAFPLQQRVCYVRYCTFPGTLKSLRDIWFDIIYRVLRLISPSFEALRARGCDILEGRTVDAIRYHKYLTPPWAPVLDRWIHEKNMGCVICWQARIFIQ